MAGKNREKDMAMAANLKKLGVTRTSMRCPGCHKVISIDSFGGHLYQCGRRTEDKPNGKKS